MEPDFIGRNEAVRRGEEISCQFRLGANVRVKRKMPIKTDQSHYRITLSN